MTLTSSALDGAVARRATSSDDEQREDRGGGERERSACASRRGYPARDWNTNSATSSICCGVSLSTYACIVPLPFVIAVRIFACVAVDLSRFGPIVPVEPAAFSVWHAPQAVETKTSLPAGVHGGATAFVVKVPFMPLPASPATVEV